ncbi:MAG: rod shape-determining protein [Planctomycetes bacterium]|nr:rod shape-determining protein [Planctomycetota bacterium]
MTATATKKVLRVGLDLGTNTSVFQVSKDGRTVKYDKDIHLSLVGYPKPGMIPGILPTDAPCIFADEAIEHRLHLDLKWPLAEGYVDDFDVSRAFAGYLRTQIDSKNEHDLWGVVGAPANSTPDKQKTIRSVFAGVFDRMLVVPEPFLAAMGLRDEDRLKTDNNYVDPTKHSLIIDIGAGTTDICLVQGYYPTAQDQQSFPIAGDAIDQALAAGIKKRYPDISLSRVTITKLKENNSFVGNKKKSAKVKVYVDGKPRSIEFGELIREACEILVDPVLDSVRAMFTRCDSEGVVNIMQNIIVAGGGSQIGGFAELIEQKLRDEGYEDAKVSTPADYKRLVALGALKIANNVRDDQWQVPL